MPCSFNMAGLRVFSSVWFKLWPERSLWQILAPLCPSCVGRADFPGSFFTTCASHNLASILFFFNIYLFGCIGSQLRHERPLLPRGWPFTVVVARRLTCLLACGVLVPCMHAQSCLTLCDPVDWGLPFPPLGDLPHPGIAPVSPASAGVIFTSKPPGKPLRFLIRDQTHVCCFGRRILTHWTTGKVPAWHLDQCCPKDFPQNKSPRGPLWKSYIVKWIWEKHWV